MGPKRTTRTSKTASAPKIEESTLQQLTSNTNEQRRIFILPKKLTADARILTLPNPATASRGRYLFCPAGGLFEFTKVGVAPNDLRSWLITQRDTRHHCEGGSLDETTNTIAPDDGLKGDYVLESPDLFIATPIDAVFFVLPVFESILKSSKASFRLDDDYGDILFEGSPELASALRLPGFRSLLLSRLRAVSEVQKFGDDILFKPSDQLLAQLILEKGKKMVQEGVWPKSMEQTFVRKQLEIPIASITSGNSQLPTPEQSITASDLDSQISDPPSEQTAKLSSAPPSPADAQSPNDPVRIRELMRIRIAINYITSSYLPRELRTSLVDLISSSGMVNYAALTEHLQTVHDANTQIQAMRSLSDNISRKRGALDDDEAQELRAEKKRRKEEEEQRKKAESRAIKQLKKVDTSGMQKLSSFFAKSASAAKSK